MPLSGCSALMFNETKHLAQILYMGVHCKCELEAPLHISDKGEIGGNFGLLIVDSLNC